MSPATTSNLRQANFLITSKIIRFFYRLPETMAAIVELQSPTTTTLAPGRCSRLFEIEALGFSGSETGAVATIKSKPVVEVADFSLTEGRGRVFRRSRREIAVGQRRVALQGQVCSRCCFAENFCERN
jgi:hypothetical protein